MTTNETMETQMENGKLKKVAINVRNVDTKLRDKFKELCAEKNISMQTGVIYLIEEAVVTKKI